MQMLYNSDQFVVVQFDRPVAGSALDEAAPSVFERFSAVAAESGRPQPQIAGGGYEIVDKSAGKEVFIDGTVAEGFRTGVEALMRDDPSAEQLDEFISRYTVLAHAPVALH